MGYLNPDEVFQHTVLTLFYWKGFADSLQWQLTFSADFFSKAEAGLLI